MADDDLSHKRAAMNLTVRRGIERHGLEVGPRTRYAAGGASAPERAPSDLAEDDP